MNKYHMFYPSHFVGLSTLDFRRCGENLCKGWVG